MNFQLFGTAHLSYIYSMLFLWIAIPIFARKYLNKTGRKNLVIALVVSIIGVEIIDDIYRMFDSNVGWFVSSDLPLHLCGFSVFATSWALIKKDQLTFELCYFWGLGGAIQAILTPDPSALHNHFYLFTFMSSHGLIILNVLYLIFVDRMVLRKWALLRTVIITNIILILIVIINLILDANYFYLCEAPDVNNPLILSREQPWYFMNMEFVSIIVLYIISIPMLIYRKKLEK